MADFQATKSPASQVNEPGWGRASHGLHFTKVQLEAMEKGVDPQELMSRVSVAGGGFVFP